MYQMNDFLLTNSSYARLKNLSVGYRFEKLGDDQLRLELPVEGFSERVRLFARQHLETVVRRIDQRTCRPGLLLAGVGKQRVGFLRVEHEPRVPRRRIFILNLRNLFFDDLQLKFAALGNRRQLFNKLFQFLKFLFQLEYFKLGESCEAQIENSLRLHFRQFETRHQLAAGIGGAFRFFDDCDY